MAYAKNMARATLSLSGDHPENFRRRRQRLSKLRGVHSVAVNYLTAMIFVEYDAGKTSLEKIRTALGLPPR